MCLLLIEPSDEDDAHSRGSQRIPRRPRPPVRPRPRRSARAPASARDGRIALSARTPTQWGRFLDYFRDAHVVMRFRRITFLEIRFF